MTIARTRTEFLAVATLGFAGTLLLAGCATKTLDAQWSDPQLTSGNPLRGARVLVVCEAQDLVLRRICQDQVGAQVTAAGAMPVAAPDGAADASGNPARYLAAATAASAKAVLVTTVAPDSSVAKSGFTVGFGLGGFGGGGFGGGVGVSAPVGDTKVATGYAANGSITDVAPGAPSARAWRTSRLTLIGLAMWSFMPAASTASRSPTIALAVIAMTGSVLQRSGRSRSARWRRSRPSPASGSPSAPRRNARGQHVERLLPVACAPR
jgi:hypothetical protein